MLRSMTGFGKGACELDGEVVTAELTSVNHRFNDCSIRAPSAWTALEPVVKAEVRKRVSRGKVNVWINRKRGMASRQQVLFDADIAKQYVAASKELAQLLRTDEALSVNVLAQLDGVFYQEEPEEDLDKVQVAVTGAVAEALDHLDAMRVTEGKALASELTYRVGLMREALAAVEERLPEINALYEERLHARVEEINADADVAEERIAIEIAMMAEKSDVTEEVVRLKTHLDHTVELLARDEPVGRELNFLAQEIHREVNTLGSKTRDADVAKDVLAMKSELERIREQVQNVE